MRIALVTSAHRPDDHRIVFKEGVSLRDAGHEVWFVGQRRIDPPSVEGIEFVLEDASKSRVFRMTVGVWRVVMAALRLDPDVFHLHDPELLVAVPFLRAAGKTIVYDAHEDLRMQVLSKEWIPAAWRGAASVAVRVAEWLVLRCVDAIIVVDPSQVGHYKKSRVALVRNLPRAEEFEAVSSGPPVAARRSVLYAGGITQLRGAVDMVRAMGELPVESDIELVLAGTCSSPKLMEELQRQPGWDRVRYTGWLGRAALMKELSSALAGLVLLHPAPNYSRCLYPVKMFEYMMAGLPIIASNLPDLAQTIADCDCGVVVKPGDYREIARVIESMTSRRSVSQEMGERGRRAALDTYNWGREERVLVALYERLSKASGRGYRENGEVIQTN